MLDALRLLALTEGGGGVIPHISLIWRSSLLRSIHGRVQSFRPWGNAGSPIDGLPSKLCATLDLSRRLRVDGHTFHDDLDAHLGVAGIPSPGTDARSRHEVAYRRVAVGACSHRFINMPVDPLRPDRVGALSAVTLEEEPSHEAPF